MIKLNLDRIAALEKQHTNDSIYLNTLQRMIDIIMEPYDILDKNMSANVLAQQTLTDLGVIDEIEKDKKSEQLNS